VRKAAREGIWLPGGVNRRIAFKYKLHEKYDEMVNGI
jgi:hypothetical protein